MEIYVDIKSSTSSLFILDVRKSREKSLQVTILAATFLFFSLHFSLLSVIYYLILAHLWIQNVLFQKSLCYRNSAETLMSGKSQCKIENPVKNAIQSRFRCSFQSNYLNTKTDTYTFCVIIFTANWTHVNNQTNISNE